MVTLRITLSDTSHPKSPIVSRFCLPS